MKAELTRSVIEEYVPKAGVDGKSESFRLQRIKAELEKLERLAEIGKATEKALKDNEYCIASYKGNHLNSIKTIEELVKWAETEE